MNRTEIEPIAIGAFAAIAMALALLAPGIGVVQLLVGLPLGLFLPGYALTSALFPARGLSIAERLLFSLGLSLALMAVGGLLLFWSKHELRPTAWTILLGAVTLLAAVVALARSWQRPAPASIGARLTKAQSIQLVLAALLVVGAVQLSRAGAAQGRNAGFTQLWMLPSDPARRNSLRLGVANHELRAMSYRLQVASGGAIVDEWPQITLAPDQQWSAIVALPEDRPAGPTVEATLYRLDEPASVYRHTVFWRGQAER